MSTYPSPQDRGDAVRDRGTMNERTPLLSFPSHSSSTYTEGHSHRDDSDASSLTTIEQTDDSLLTLLSRVNGNGTIAPLGLEPEVLPSISGILNDDGEYRIGCRGELLSGKAVDEENQSLLPTEITVLEVKRGRFWIIFAAILLSNFVGAFDSTIMASTHTSITSAFHSSELASWLSTSFLLTSTSFQPLFGRLSDVTGRRLPFVVSSSIFTLATIWCALAQSFGSFVAARAVCGLGAAGMFTMASITLSDIIPIGNRAIYQSLGNLAWGTGAVLGAGLGGFLADTVGWRWEFGLQVPFGVFVIIVGGYVIPSFPSNHSHKSMNIWERFDDFDWAGSFYLVSSVGTLILGMSLGGNLYRWTDYHVLLPLGLSLIFSVLLYRTESRVKSPVLPLDLVLSKPQGNVVFAGFFTMLTVNSIIFNLPLYFQTVLLESATKAGSRLLIPSVASTVGSAITGAIVTRTGYVSYTMYFGSAMVVLGSSIFCLLHRDAQSWVYTVTLIPANMGLGAFLPSQLMGILGLSWDKDHAVATSNTFMLRALGSVIGIASSGLIVQNGLVYYLDEFVRGEGKEEVIRKVRNSVTAVLELDKVHQDQVIRAYEASLRWCFLFTVVTSLIAASILFGVKLPNLKDKESDRVVMRKSFVQKDTE